MELLHELFIDHHYTLHPTISMSSDLPKFQPALDLSSVLSLCLSVYVCLRVSVSVCDRTPPNPNAANINIVADLYAEVIGVLAQSRYQHLHL